MIQLNQSKSQMQIHNEADRLMIREAINQNYKAHIRDELYNKLLLTIRNEL